MTKTVCITLGYRSDFKICKQSLYKGSSAIMWYVFTKKKKKNHHYEKSQAYGKNRAGV